MRDAAVAALDELAEDDGIGVVVITGAGEKSFVAGADIAEFEGRSPFDQRDAMRSPRIFDAMASFPKPVIAMINGFCLGGGCELAMSCDIRTASETARFGQPEINLGLIPGGGGTQRMPRLVGVGQTLRLILSGDMIPAAEARSIGLVELVFAPEQLREETLKLAHKIASKSPLTLRIAKEAAARRRATAARGRHHLRARPLLPRLLHRRQGRRRQGLPGKAPGRVEGPLAKPLKAAKRPLGKEGRPFPPADVLIWLRQ